MRAVSEAPSGGARSGIAVERAFVRLPEGLMHYRHAGETPTTVWLMHASPASSASLEALVAALGGDCRAIAPDTPGYGDSAALGLEAPALQDYADAQFRMMDRLGVARAVLYGHHTGAHLAIEMAIHAPERVAGLVLDGLLWLSDAEREEYLREYAPPMPPDSWGTQVFQALQWLRDQAWFFPHFRKDAAHNVGLGALPPEVLHALLIDLLKAGPGYRDAYQAVFAQPLQRRLPLLQAPVLMLETAHAPGGAQAVDHALRLLVDGQRRQVPEGWSVADIGHKAAEIVAFAARGCDRICRSEPPHA
jgi:pimeloyl-ACP methyl ester carboxylesterase